MASEPWERERLELPIPTQPLAQRPLYPFGYGQGLGWRIKHQRDDVVARAQERLGFLCIRSGRPGMELRVGAEYLSSDRRLAWRPRPEVPRNGWPGFRRARAGPQPDRACHAGRRTLGRDSDL